MIYVIYEIVVRDGLQAQWAMGQAMTVEQAIELALDDQLESSTRRLGPHV